MLRENLLLKRQHVTVKGLQAASRASKQSAKDSDDYTALYASFAQLLVATAPLVVPENTSAATLESDDALATLAERLVEALGAFVLNGHLVRVDSSEVQLGVLWQLARLLGSPHLPLAVLTLPAWRRLVQMHERVANHVAGAIHSCLAQKWSCLRLR